MLNIKIAYKVLTNIFDCEKLVADSFWEDDEDRLLHSYVERSLANV